MFVRWCLFLRLKRFFKPKEGLSDPKGSLSSRLPSQAIALAIKEVEKGTTSEKGKKRGQYTWIPDQQDSKRVEVAGVNDKHSVPLDRRFFLSHVQKIDTEVPIVRPLVQNFLIKFYNREIYGVR